MPWEHFTADLQPDEWLRTEALHELIHALRQRHDALGWGDLDPAWLSSHAGSRWPASGVRTAAGVDTVLGGLLGLVGGAYTDGTGPWYGAAPWWPWPDNSILRHVMVVSGLSQDEATSVAAARWGWRVARVANAWRQAMGHLRECVLVPVDGAVCQATGYGTTWAAAVAAAFAATPVITRTAWSDAEPRAQGKRFSSTSWSFMRRWMEGVVPPVATVALGPADVWATGSPLGATGRVVIGLAHADWSIGALARVATGLTPVAGATIRVGPAACFDASVALTACDPTAVPEVAVITSLQGHLRSLPSEVEHVGLYVRPSFADL